MIETLTIQSLKNIWSPANNPEFKIWTVITDKGERRTMSKAIGEGIGQTFECERYKNDKGKEYIRQNKKDDFKKGGGDVVGIEVGHAINCACTIMAQDPNPSIDDIENWAKQILELGDKMKAERRGAPPKQNAQELPWSNKSALDICKDAGLGDRISIAGMPESHIDQVFEDVDKHSAKLVVEIGKQLAAAGY